MTDEIIQYLIDSEADWKFNQTETVMHNGRTYNIIKQRMNPPSYKFAVEDADTGDTLGKYRTIIEVTTAIANF